MSSHHDWETEIIAQHARETPFAPENGQPLKFVVGDAVIYTNDYGVSFGPRRVTGLYQPDMPSSLYATGYRYYLDKDSHWMPVKESSLSAVPAESLAAATA